MAPSYSTSPIAALRIPWRRFAIQVVFSMPAILVPNLLQKCDSLPLSGLITFPCVAYADLILTSRNRLAKSRSPHYCILLSLCLGYLHQLTTAIGRYFLDSSSGFSQMQHVAVHFCLAFLVVSEFEFYRAYIDVKKVESSLDAVRYFLKANIELDHVFPVSRDPWVFGYTKLSDEPNFKILSESTGFHVGQLLIFWIVGGLANVLRKHIVYPISSDGRSIWWAMTSTNVFFTTEDALQLILNVPLLKVVRQANHVGVWAVVDAVEGWKARAEAQDKSAFNADK